MIEQFGYPSKNEVLYLGVQRKPIINPDLRDTLNIPQNSVVLTSIGFNIQTKGFDILIKSIQDLTEEHQLRETIRVLIVGVEHNSKEDKKLHDLIQEAGLTDIVIPLGIRNDINDILNISDIYLQPSRTEGISLSIMEALNYGLPVIGTRVGGIPEVVRDGKNGYLFAKNNPEELADKIKKPVNDSELRNEMGKRSFAISKEFSLPNSVRKLAAIYHQ